MDDLATSMVESGLSMGSDDTVSTASIDAMVDLTEKLPPMAQSDLVRPRTITGSASVSNKGALDWSNHGLVAYGSHCTIMVVDTRNVQIVQSLDRHKSVVKKILWVSSVESNPDGSPSIQLVSGDASGHLIHWDVAAAAAIAVLQDGNKPVLGLEWVPGLENDLMLAALHSPYFFIIWDIKKQTKLWKKSFTDTLLSFHFDPFDSSKIAFLCHDCILFVDDFLINKIPSTNGRKFYISTPRLDSSSDESLRGRDRLKKLMKGLVVGETKPKPDELMTITECLQLAYHKSLRHHLFLLYPRDIILIDLHINQTIGIIPMERTMSSLVQIVTTRQRDVIYCLHESGSVSMKVRRGYNHAEQISGASLDFGSFSTDMFLCYESKCQSEMIRQMKGSKVLGMSVDPISEKNIGLFMSSGKVVFLELDNSNCIGRSLTQIIAPHKSGNLRLIPVSVLSNMNGNITMIKMCPPIKTKKMEHKVLVFGVALAVATTTGYIYIYNLADGTVIKEMAIHSQPIRGLEWTSFTSLITYAFGDGPKVRNEIFITDRCSGQSIPIRSETAMENPISILKVSPLKQFFVIALKDGPFELWDLRTLTLIRTMAKKFPLVQALEWSPIHSLRSLRSVRKSTPDLSENDSGVPQYAREYLVFSDNESHLYHFSVDKDGIKDGIKIPPEPGGGVVTTIAFKSNKIVQGDSDGRLCIWELKAKKANKTDTNRGPVRQLKFAPGKTNLKLLILFNEEIEIVDLTEKGSDKISSLKWNRDSKIIDVDWANSDCPVIATEDGWIRILDLTLTKSSSHISKYHFREDLNCPAVLPPKILSRVHFLLCTQYWRLSPNYTNFTVQDGIPEQELQRVNAQLKMLNIGDDFETLNVAEKCLRMSHLLGDNYGVDLWTVALYYLKTYKPPTNDVNYKPGGETISMDLKRTNKNPEVEPLDTCYDYLMDPYSYQRLQLERVSFHEWKRGDYKHTQRVVEKLILLGEMDRAVQLLLETDIDNPNYYGDAIKACLVATIQKTGAAQSTIKLVATNLIANGKIWEGVQLLCLIGKGLDGCRYLVSYGMWEQAVWLAKSVLPPIETLEVMKKFSDHLVSKGDRFAAILVLISQYQFEKALEMLHNQHQLLIASYLLMSCRHYNVPINQSLSIAIYSSLHDYLVTIGNEEAANGLAEYLSISG